MKICRVVIGFYTFIDPRDVSLLFIVLVFKIPYWEKVSLWSVRNYYTIIYVNNMILSDPWKLLGP